jgi:hypothetical protein
MIAALATSAIVLSGGSALGAHQVAATGSPGAWVLPDSAGDPAARCSYTGGGVAGGTYLTGIKQRNSIKLFGTASNKRPVGVRAIIQHKVSGSWVTVKKGLIYTVRVTLTEPATISTGLTTFGVTEQPGEPYRLMLKLIWYRFDGYEPPIDGTRTILVDRYVPRDGGVARRCKGFVSNVAS